MGRRLRMCILCGRLLRQQWNCAKSEYAGDHEQTADVSILADRHSISSRRGESRPVLLDLYNRRIHVRQAGKGSRD
jgi:hypothetical protein